MSNKAPYRNARRTNKAIKLAFLKLLGEKDISKIKVIEITELADISKGTFYTHFKDVESVLDEIENDSLSSLKEFLKPLECYDLLSNFTPLLINIFKKVEEEKDLYKLIFTSSCRDRFIKKLQNTFVNYMMSQYHQVIKFKEKDSAKYYFNFISGGTASIIYEWVLYGHTLSIEDLAININTGLIYGVSSIFKDLPLK